MTDSNVGSTAGPVRLVVASLLVGGGVVCVGSALPWMSFFAGLQSLSGLVGLYGRILFASGALAVLAGTAMLRHGYRWLQPATGVLGVMQTLFILWLLLGVRSTIRELGTHAMLLARPGPGLFVALAGALLIAMTAPRWRAEHASVARHRKEVLLHESTRTVES